MHLHFGPFFRDIFERLKKNRERKKMVELYGENHPYFLRWERKQQQKKFFEEVMSFIIYCIVIGSLIFIFFFDGIPQILDLLKNY